MQIPTSVHRFGLIFLRYLFVQSVLDILQLWNSGLFDCKHCCNTPQVNTDQLG